MEEDQNSENVEVTPHDQESTVVEEFDQGSSEGETQGQEESPQEKNWRELRRKADDAEKRQREYEEKLKIQDEFIKNLLQSQKSQEAPPPPKEVDEFEALPEDEYLPYGQTRKFVQKSARQIAREEYLAMEKERETARFRERLQSKYADFDEVVNPETIALFERQEPELATTIADLKDPYKMGLQTYNFIKKMGLAGSPEEKRHAREVEKKIEKNEKTVQSPQAYNKRPMAQAFSMANMSTDEKQRLYEEMMGFAGQSPGY